MKKDLVKLIKKSSVDILYLGLGASALCFVTWNFAVKELGAVKTSVYIYMDSGDNGHYFCTNFT